jgi:anti-sigma factor RsiW
MTSRFDELLPFYVNGTLSEIDRAWVERYLREQPQAADELRWLRAVQTTVQAEAVPASSEVGLDRVMQRIHGERKPAAAAKPRGLAAWVARLLSPPVLKPMFAGAMAVVALQAVVISSLMNAREETSPVRTPTSATNVAEHGAYVKLNFKPDARAADIRMLLIDVQGSLASGPGQLGDYYLRVPESQVAAVTARLNVSPIVEGVAVVDALPAWP